MIVLSIIEESLLFSDDVRNNLENDVVDYLEIHDRKQSPRNHARNQPVLQQTLG